MSKNSQFTLSAKPTSFPSIANKSVDLDGLRVAYKEEGTGRAILCLHALGHSSKDFLSLYQLPLTEYRVISLDFPGHGVSGVGLQPVSAAYFARVVEAFINRLDLRDLVLVGNSIGGAVAIRLAARNPNVRLISLSNPAGLDSRDWLAPLFLNVMVGFFQYGVKRGMGYRVLFGWYYRLVLVNRKATARRKEITGDAILLAPALVEGWRSFRETSEDLRPSIHQVLCPVLFTWCMKDRFVQFNRNKKAIQQFAHYKLIRYGVGHTPYIECPQEFLKDFQNFLNANNPAADKRSIS